MTIMLRRALNSTFLNWPRATVRNAYPRVLSSEKFVGIKKIFGEITHGDRDPKGRLFPNAYQKIQVVSVGLVFNKLLAETEADQYGWYGLEYPSTEDDNIEIRLVEKPAAFAKWTKNDNKDRCIQRFKFTIPINADKTRVDLPCDYLNQMTDFTNVCKVPVHLQPPPGFFIGVLFPVLRHVPKALLIRSLKGRISANHIQKLYDGTKIVKRTPRNEEVFLNSLMNGICNFKRTKLSDGCYLWSSNLPKYETDREGSIVAVDLIGRVEKRKLRIELITLQYPGGTKSTVTPDMPDFEMALFQAWRMFTVEGETGPHLGECHMLPYIVGLHFEKFIKKNPIRHLIGGHFSGCHFIAFLAAEGIIFKEGSTIASSGLSPKGSSDKVMHSVQMGANWKLYQPPEEICEQDCFAHDEALNDEILHRFLKNNIQLHRKEIEQHWIEIYRFSYALHAMLPNCPLITENESDPTEEDLLNLELFSAWISNILTYKHWAEHTFQGDLRDFNKVVFGQAGHGVDAHGKMVFGANADTEDLSSQRLVIEALLGANIKSTLLANDDGAYHPDYVAAFRGNLHRFKTPGIASMSGSVRI